MVTDMNGRVAYNWTKKKRKLTQTIRRRNTLHVILNDFQGPTWLSGKVFDS